MGGPSELDIRTGAPESFGWVRKKDLDTQCGVAYERPDGQLYLFPKEGPFQIFRMKGIDWARKPKPNGRA